MAKLSAGSLVEVAERQPQRRRTGDDGDAALVDRCERGRGIEALHEHDRGADAQAETEHDVEPEDVEQRQHAVDDVVGVDVAVRRQALLDVGQQVAVAEHRRPRRAGGAAGEDQHGQVRRLDVDRRQRPSAREQSSNATVPGSIGAPRWRRRSRPSARRPIDARPVGGATGSTTTTLAPTVAISRSISGAGLAGLSGTATAPRPSVAR